MALLEEPSADCEPLPPAKPPVSLFALYRTFFWVGIFSFGGGLSGWLHREIVNTRGWMTDDEFFSGYSLTHILPGVNSSNLTVYIGQHLRGLPGAVTALLGLLSAPFVIIISAAYAYHTLLGVPGFQAAMAGIAAAAIGMLVRLGLVAARRSVTTGIAPAFVVLVIFVLVGFLRWPLIPVVFAMAPVSIALSWPRKPKTDA